MLCKFIVNLSQTLLFVLMIVYTDELLKIYVIVDSKFCAVCWF